MEIRSMNSYELIIGIKMFKGFAVSNLACKISYKDNLNAIAFSNINQNETRINEITLNRFQDR